VKIFSRFWSTRLVSTPNSPDARSPAGGKVPLAAWYITYRKEASMPTVTNTIIGKLSFFEEHLPVWSADPAAIGIDAAQIASLALLVNTARTDFDNAAAIRNSALAATEAQKNSIDAMYQLGADLLKTIRAFAETTNDPGVYVTAEIPAPAPPTPAGPPDKPTELAAGLLPSGGLHLTWKGTLSKSAYFAVYRKAEGESTFTLLDAPADKFFDDTTIPSGANNVTYYIQGRRDTFRVDSAWFQVNFGSGATTVTELAMAS